MSALLELDAISVSLKGRQVLRDISISASSGEFIGMIGPNGAGKTTLLRASAGLCPISTGVRKVSGAALETFTPIDRARRLSYLPQARPVYWGIDVRAIVALGRFAYGNPLTEDMRDASAITRALDECGAAYLSDRAADTLSGGELARIHLARALAGEAPLMLADEPIAALDPEHQLDVMALLRTKANEGRAIIAALHDLPLAARYCTRLIVLHQGRIGADGAPGAVLTPQLLRDVFNVEAAIDHQENELRMVMRPLAR